MSGRRLAAAAILALLGASSTNAAIRYLAFGDSITRGSNCPNQGPNPTKIFDEEGLGCNAPCNDQAAADECAYAWRLEEALATAGVEAKVVNKGHGGETTAAGITRIDSLLDDGYDVLLLMEGTNDIFQGINPEVVRDNLAVMDDKATAQGVDTVHGTIIHTLDEDNESPTEDLRDDLIALAAARNRYLADPWAVLCPDPGCFDDHYSDVESTVGHVDASGYDIMAGIWSAAITSAGPPGLASPIAPSGGITDSTPTFVWSRVDAANWYELSIDSTSENVFGAWLQEADVCAGGETCTMTRGAPLEAGDYTWRVRTRNPRDLGPRSAPMSFTVLGAGGLVPVGLTVDPSELTSDGNGVFEPGETVETAPSWRNGSGEAVSADGSLADYTGPAGASYAILVNGVDYALPAGETGSCQDTGDGCYELRIQLTGENRPGLHWDATVEEELEIGPGEAQSHAWTLHVGDSFADVSRASPVYPFVETLLHNQIASGCNPSAYCPASANSRAQMAVFLLRTLEGATYQPPACHEGEETFADLPATRPLCPWIEELVERGIVAGCGGGNYCPNSTVTRAQMAIFLLKSLEGSDYTPPTCSGMFADVPCPSLFADWIEELFERNVTSGCATEPLAYCPTTRVTRAQMAVFLTRTFGLELYGP